MYFDEAFRRSKSFFVGGLLVEFPIIALMNNVETLLTPCSGCFLHFLLLPVIIFFTGTLSLSAITTLTVYIFLNSSRILGRRV